MPKITEMYAFVCEDGPGDEGVLGILGEDGKWLPLVGADMERVDSLRPLVLELARVTKKPVRLLHFTHMETIEVINP